MRLDGNEISPGDVTYARSRECSIYASARRLSSSEVVEAAEAEQPYCCFMQSRGGGGAQERQRESEVDVRLRDRRLEGLYGWLCQCGGEGKKG